MTADARVAGRPEARRLVDALEELECSPVSKQTQEAAGSLAAAAREAGREDLARSAEILGLDARVRSEGIGDALTVAQEYLRWAEETGAQRLAARCHALLAMVHILSGDPGRGAEHGTWAVAALDGRERPRVRARLLTRQAVGLFVAGAFRQGFSVTAEAMRLAEGVADDDLAVQLLTNATLAALNSGLDEEAGEWGGRLERAVADSPRLRAQSWEALARAYLNAGRVAEALEVLRLAEQELPDALEADDRASRLLLAATAHRLSGDLELAHDLVTQARRAAVAGELWDVRVAALEEEAAWAAAAGDHRAAYELHRRFHAMSRKRLYEATSSRAVELFAQHSTEEALRRAAAAEDASERDVLTGVPNRRWVEGKLPDVLRSRARAHLPTALVIADVDHFKRVNDGWGHAVGDEVLRAVGGCLLAHRDVHAAARLGGEEFLFLLHCPPGERPAVLDGVLRAVADLRWPDVDPGLRVTVSCGVAEVSGPQDTLSELLRQADGYLYHAKRGGRARAVGAWSVHP